MNLKPLIERLEDAQIGERGVDLFIGMLPSSAKLATLLRSPLSGSKIDHYLPGYFQSDYQVIVRAQREEDGELLMARVTEVLTFGRLQLGELCFNYSRPRTLPAMFPLSKGDLLEFNVMFDACWVQ